MAESIKQICFYFQIHQPYRINTVLEGKTGNWRDFFVGRNPGKYGEDMTNVAIFKKVAINCYIPTTKFWIKFLKQNPTFKLSLSFSGTFLEQCQEFPEYGQQVLELFKELVDTKQVEIFSETYYHSLVFLVDLEEYLEQIIRHRELIKRLFNYKTTTFRNTELIYNNHIGSIIRSLGFDTIVLESAAWKPRKDISKSFYANSDYNLSKQELDLIEKYKIKENSNSGLKLFFRNRSCSDGLMFIGKDSHVPGLLANQVIKSKQQQIGIFTDYEFLGEHNRGDQEAIINLENQLKYLLSHGYEFKTVTEVNKQVELLNYQNRFLESFDCPEFTSWAHKDRDITVWRGGEEQEQAFLQLESFYWAIIKLNRLDLLPAWRRLSTSCHFYFLGNKEGFDKEFVDLFSPYESVLEALDIYLQVLHQLKQQL